MNASSGRIDPKRVLVTGGAGFIGSALVRRLIGSGACEVLNLDKLTYAGNLDSLGATRRSPRHHFHQGDISDTGEMGRVFQDFKPQAVYHLAAESHVDRSIDGPADFIRTNIEGTFVLLEAARSYWVGLGTDEKLAFRMLHISTDEVFGSLSSEGFFTEDTPYQPSSPYSSSKAASDHLVRAWHHTYGLPVLVTNCSNNYGPYQFPEKLIPLMILNGLEGKELPVYGKGENTRDWLYVDDHARALVEVLRRGTPGRTYNIGARSERTNLQAVQHICALLDELAPDRRIGPREGLIRYVQDRPGHDLRYAIDPSRIEEELGWKAERDFESGMRLTVQWYLHNTGWWQRVREGSYRGERLGLGEAS